MINRDLYMNKLMPFKDKQLIKVIVGMRRSGKSTFLDLLEEKLKSSGVAQENIIHMKFESLEYDDINDYMKLYNFLKPKLEHEKTTYLLLDEIQMVNGWEKVVNSVFVDFNVDIYITGSNAYLLSSELSTLIAGRYVELKMYPLSFKEYIEFNNFDDKTTVEEKFYLFLRYGGLPGIAQLIKDENVITMFLQGIYNTVIMKDVVQRNTIKDVALLECVMKYLASNIGSAVSVNKISGYLTSIGRKTSSETIDNYIKMLEKAYIIHGANRYDIKGKELLKTLGKYYIVDIGIRNAILGFRGGDIGHILENIVYIELLRRGYVVTIGKVSNLEVDFIAKNQNEIIYYQVSQTLSNPDTLKRELQSLKSIEDNYEKVILTMDRPFNTSDEGIKFKNIIEFLLN